MLLSKFNLWVKDYPKDGEYLLFNTRTQALIKINQELKDGLDNISNQVPGARCQVPGKDLKALKENGIIVEDEKEEQAKLEDFFRQLKYESGTLPFEVTILTTYNCNFKCVYCFEQQVKQSLSLDERSSDLISQWIIQRAEKRNFKKIFLVYYGGEPLLNTPPIYQISSKVKKYAQKNGIGFSFGIITNGSLIEPKLVDELLALGLENIRITIDGDKKAHDKKRPFSDGRPSFELIIKNIKSIIDKVNIGIAGNFDRENFESIFRLLDYLEEEGLLHKLNKIDFAPLAPRLGPKANPGAIELSECLAFIGKEGLFNEIISIKKELLSRGVKMSTGLAINACSLIMQDGGVTIDPRGDIYKCNSFLGYPEFSLGNVREEELNAQAREFLEMDVWNKCPKDCPYVPMCQGGCRFFSYLENKNFTDIFCKREYFERVTPELIKLEYQKLIQG